MPYSFVFPFQLYSDAESSFAQVLKLDKHCEDAMFELARVRVQQLEVRSNLTQSPDNEFYEGLPDISARLLQIKGKWY